MTPKAKMQHQGTMQQFVLSYTPCHPNSCYHDLACGHRIQVAYNTEHCGVNCKHPQNGAPFVCPDCVTSDVRLEMTFEGLDINTSEDPNMSDDTTASREDRTQVIADSELKKLLAQGRRMCKVTPKFKDPKLQFWHQFLTEEGFGGLEEDVDVVVADTRYKYINPRLAKESASKLKETWKPREAAQQMGDEDQEEEVTFTLAEFAADWKEYVRQYQVHVLSEATSEMDDAMNSLIDYMNETHVGLAIEDEASKAVREAFDMCELSGGHL
jgi:hypothetical protein